MPSDDAGGFFLAAVVTRVTPWLRVGYALRVTIQPSHIKDLKAKNALVTPVTPKIIKLFLAIN